MIQGTTPTHTFKLPFGTNDILKLRITYYQLGRTVVEKTEDDVYMMGDTISLTLTQRETLMFNPRDNVKLQVKVLTVSGSVLASMVKELTVYEILNKEVLI